MRSHVCMEKRSIILSIEWHVKKKSENDFDSRPTLFCVFVSNVFMQPYEINIGLACGAVLLHVYVCS